MRRRAFLGTAGATVAGLAGCLGVFGGSESEPHVRKRRFRFYFEDETGTLGAVGDHSAAPSDAADHQVVRNTHTEADWRAMRENDAAFAFCGECAAALD